MVVFKLRNNKKLTKEDLKTLEDIMWSKLGSASDYEKEFGNMPVGKLVRKIVGVDRAAANDARNIMSIIAQIKNNSEEVV